MTLSPSLVELVMRCLRVVLAVFLTVPATAGATTFGAEVNSDFVSQVRGQWSQSQGASNLTALYSAGGRVGRADSNWATISWTVSTRWPS